MEASILGDARGDDVRADGIMTALNCHVERVFNPDRKETHGPLFACFRINPQRRYST
jgi:hypothetical protein